MRRRPVRCDFLGPPPSEAAEAVGVCGGDLSRALFFDTVAEVIVPRLEALGLAATAAWSTARPAAPAFRKISYGMAH